MDRRVTILEAIERKSQEKAKEVKFNPWGKRIIENWCAYANDLAQRKREKAKKEIVVSAITAEDQKTFKAALERLKKERASQQRPLRSLLKRLTSSRSVKRVKSEKVIKKDDNYIPCAIDYKKPDKLKSTTSIKKQKPKSAEPLKKSRKDLYKFIPLKKKTKQPDEKRSSTVEPVEKPKPTVVYPPVKTRPWFPCASRAKPIVKPKVEYPPLTLRKTPWQSPKKSVKPRAPRVRLEKTFYPIPVSTIGKCWHNFKFIGGKLQILRGHSSQYSRKFNFRSNGKQSAFIAVVALVNAKLCPMKLWATDDLDEIVSYGDINFRKQMRKFHRLAMIKPPEIKFKVYTSRAKIYTEIGTKTMRGIFDQTETKDFEKHLEQMLTDFGMTIFTYCGQSFAIWKELNAFYLFNSEDTDENGKLVEKRHGACCVLRTSDSIAQLAIYLAGHLRNTKKCYELYSFKINEKVALKDEEKKIEVPEKEKDETAQALGASSSKKDFFKTRQTGFAAVMFERQPQPDIGGSFNKSTLPSHGFLRCDEFLTANRDSSRRAPFVCSTAIAMLRLCKSSLWKASTMRDIFRLGRELFTKNVDDVLEEREAKRLQLLKDLSELELKVEEKQESQVEAPAKRKPKKEKPKRSESAVKIQDIPITEIHPVLSLKSLQLEIHAENVVFGQIQKRGHDVIALEDGLRHFFRNFDCGLIQGPDVVAIWKEQNYFFMFDPNQCEDFQRSKEGENSCLSWFKELEDLTKLYVDNIPREFRNSIFKIAKVDILDYEQIARGWRNFKAVGPSKWILSGNVSESSDMFREENRSHQSTCIAVAALGKTLELGVQSWTTETVNEIVELGDEFYSGSMMTLEDEGKLKDRDLLLSEIGTELKFDKTIIDFVFDDCAVAGTLEDNGQLPSLAQGLNKFFADDNLGVITTCGISLAVWKRLDEFYLFDSHARDERGRNLKAIDPIDGCMVPGTACVLRFLSTDDLAKHVIANVEIGDNSAYNISRVEASTRTSVFPCLYNYKKFGNAPFAAILFAFNDLHEDSEQFRSKLSQKTFCNLVACLSFTKILNPRQWQSHDINEILKIGYKLLCGIANNHDESLWSSFETIELSSVKLSLKLKSEHIGTFTGKKRVLPTAANSVETIEDQVKISELELRASKPLITFSETKMPYASTIFTEDGDHFDSLLTVLNGWHSEREVFAILHSVIFDIAIFKLDRFYFVFDPKASDELGLMVQQRLEDLIKRTMAEERKKLIDAISDTTVKRLSLQEEFQELIFGRQVVFVPPIRKASLPVIAPDVNNDMSPIRIREKGGAYIAWFSSIDLLHQHIRRKIPNRFVNESFTLSFFTITKTQSTEQTLEPWNNFNQISVNHWILRASLSQNDTQFSQVNRNNQDVANAVLALTFAELCSPTDWTPTVLDIILKLGNRLYKKSLAILVKISSSLPSNLRLRLEQLDLPVFLRPFVISVNDELIRKEPIVKANESEPLESMKKALMEFFASSEPSGILSSKDYHVAVWKADDGAYMMFDPHDIGPSGIRKPTGFACLQRFTDHKKLVEFFHRNIKELDGINEYQLTRVSVVKNYFRETNEDGDHRRLESEVDNLSAYSDYNMFTSTGDVRSIRALDVNTVEWTEENMPLGICYAVATLCISRSLDPEFYTRDIIDKMLTLGNELINQCEGICFSDFDLCNQQLCPDEINWNFELNNVHANIQMEIFQRGVVSIHPCPAPKLVNAIEEFFNFCSVGVLITQCFVVAIWKEPGAFCIFYSCPIDEAGRILKAKRVQTSHESHQASPGLVMFKSVNELCDNIISNIDRESYCKPFELRSCTITMTDYDVEPVSICDCSQAIKKLVKEEIVMPAVEAVPEISKQAEKKCKAEARNELVELIRAKKGSSSFTPYANGEFICGQLSRSSTLFNEFTRLYHAGAICLVSVANSSLQALSCWCGKTIDCVIKCGNSLYIESTVANNAKELTMSMLVTSLHLGGAEIVLKVLPFHEIARDEWNHESLLFKLCHLFSCYTSGYLCRGLECWAIFKREKAFYLFDPLGLEVSAKTCQRRAVLYKFEAIETMIETLFDCVNESTTDEANDESVEIGVIVSCPLSPRPTIKKTPIEVSPPKKKKVTTRCGKLTKPVRPFKTQWMNCQLTKELETSCRCAKIPTK